MENMPGKNFTEEQLVERLCQITALTESDARWFLEWQPEMFEGFTELDELNYRYDSRYGWGIQIMDEAEFNERYGEYAGPDGYIDEVPDGSIFRDAGLSGVVVVYGFVG